MNELVVFHTTHSRKKNYWFHELRIEKKSFEKFIRLKEEQIPIEAKQACKS